MKKVKEYGNRKVLGVAFFLTFLPILILKPNLNPLFAPCVSENQFGLEESRKRDRLEDSLINNTDGLLIDGESWAMHPIDPIPSSGSDGVKLADVNGDDFLDLVTGFEEGGISRIYINPGPDHVLQYWEYVELKSPDVEDAVLTDLNNKGVMDLVTASEGFTNQIMFHWAPDDPVDYLDASKWRTEVVPATDHFSAWMFVVPVEMDGENGMDLIIGSKRKKEEEGKDQAVVGWLKCPKDPENVNDWKYYPLTKAGWIMSIEITDMNGDNHPDILLSDRKNSTQTGVRWLENPGIDKREFYAEWKSHLIGVEDGEPMFLSLADLNGDRLSDIVVPDLYEGIKIFEQLQDSEHRWKAYHLPFPEWAGQRGKSVAVGDVNLDGNPDMVLSFEEEGKVAAMPYEEYRKEGKYSVIWGTYQGNPFSGNWRFFKVSGLRGRKFDLVSLIDLDGDGDLDILSNDENEEGDGLGVVWYENPLK